MSIKEPKFKVGDKVFCTHWRWKKRKLKVLKVSYDPKENFYGISARCSIGNLIYADESQFELDTTVMRLLEDAEVKE